MLCKILPYKGHLQSSSEMIPKSTVFFKGRRMKACPYYTSRLSLPLAEVVVLPYNILLHRAMREASGIRLEGNIVLIDEAHNLLETINAVYSVMITGAQLSKAHSQLSQYEQRQVEHYSNNLGINPVVNNDLHT